MKSPRHQNQRAVYPLGSFHREDDSDDKLFYVEPRLVVHIDEPAVQAIRDYLSATLPRGGAVLDLMSSWRSHMPEGLVGRTVGLGLNAVELAENPQLHERVIHDLNADPVLPFDDGSFDAAVVTVSVQYMVRPVEVFAQVSRVLKEGASFHVIYSSRMFPTKAVAVWKALNDGERADLIASYFAYGGGWSTPRSLDISPRVSPYSDPVYVVTANGSVEQRASSDALWRRPSETGTTEA